MLGVGNPIVERQKWPLDYKRGGCHSLVGTNGKRPHRAGSQRQAILLILFSSILGFWQRGQVSGRPSEGQYQPGPGESQVCLFFPRLVAVPGFSSRVTELWH